MIQFFWSESINKVLDTPAQSVTNDDGWASVSTEFLSTIQAILLLPFNSKSFSEAAEVILSGVRAAAQADGNKASISAITSEDDCAALNYQRALGLGANIIIEPLTPPAIEVIAPIASIPTIALNTYDNGKPNQNLYLPSLSLENDASQIASLMFSQGIRQPIITTQIEDPLSQRTAEAFKQSGHKIEKKPLISLINKRDLPLQLPQDFFSYNAVFLALPKAEIKKSV